MSGELLSSKIVIEEEPPSLQTIQGVATAVGHCVGVTERGPIGVATLCTSYAQWRRVFGNEIAAGIAAPSIAGFFQNGGQRLYFTRTVHYTNIALAESKTSIAASLILKTAATAASPGSVLGSVAEPFALVDGDTVIVDLNGDGDHTATINATQAQTVDGGQSPYTLADGNVLLVKVDGNPAQTVTFQSSEFVDIAAATPEECAAVINAQLVGASAWVDGSVLRIRSDTYGTAAHIEVTGGNANDGLQFQTPVTNGTGNVADVSQVSVAELKTIVEAAVVGLTVTNDAGRVRLTSSSVGVNSSVQVAAASTADDELGFNNAIHNGTTGVAADTLRVDGKSDGTYANDITVLVAPASSGNPFDFNLVVLDDGVVVERWPNLTMNDAGARFAELVVNHQKTGSEYIRVTDLDATPTTAAAQRPVNSPGSTPVPFGPLAGGDDGLVGLGDLDFIGDPAAKTGIRSFDTKDDGTLLFIPDRPTPAVANAMITYCDITRGGAIFAILDAPAGHTEETAVTYFETDAAVLEFSEYGAAYWPQIRVLNPNKSVYGSDDNIVVPPSGHIAGVYSRIDGARVGGVYDPPGGVINGRLFGVVGLETDAVLEETVRDIIYPKRINPITRLPGQPFALDGVRTLRSTGNFPTIAERRGAMFIERSVKQGTQFARLRNNDESLRAEVSRSIIAFLIVQMRAKAFRSMDPEKAFFVDVSEALNPDSEVFAGKLRGRIGIATQKPAEFVIFSFSQDTRAIDEELAAAVG